VLVIAGDADPGQPVPVVSLVERFGEDRAMTDTLACIEAVIATHLNSLQ
jgi:hypothetical protein